MVTKGVTTSRKEEWVPVARPLQLDPEPPSLPPEQRAQRIVGKIWSSLFALERIGKCDDEEAKLGVFVAPVWDKKERKLANKIRNVYAHEYRSIDADGSVHFANFKGSRTHHLPLVEQDWEIISSLLNRVQMNLATAWQCPVCGKSKRGGNDTCLQCTDPWKPPPQVIPILQSFCSIGEAELTPGWRAIHRWQVTSEGWDYILTKGWGLAKFNTGLFTSPKGGGPIVPLRF